MMVPIVMELRENDDIREYLRGLGARTNVIINNQEKLFEAVIEDRKKIIGTIIPDIKQLLSTQIEIKDAINVLINNQNNTLKIQDDITEKMERIDKKTDEMGGQMIEMIKRSYEIADSVNNLQNDYISKIYGNKLPTNYSEKELEEEVLNKLSNEELNKLKHLIISNRSKHRKNGKSECEKMCDINIDKINKINEKKIK